MELFTLQQSAPAIYTVKTFAAPPPNSDWHTTLPPGELWHLQAVHFRLVCSADPGWRRPRLEFDPTNVGTRTFLQPASYLVSAGQTVDAWWVRGSVSPTVVQPYIGEYSGLTQLGEMWVAEGDLHLRVEGRQPADAIQLVELTYFLYEAG